jgi:ABC-type antimicrobial peptide transport system permease subunit
MRIRIVVITGAVLCLLLSWTGVATAASPQDIYNDYMADGHIDGNYTAAELQAFLGDASLHQYGDPTITSSLDSMVTNLLAASTSTGDSRSGFPFTGAQLALMGVGAIALICGGIALRKLAKNRS